MRINDPIFSKCNFRCFVFVPFHLKIPNFHPSPKKSSNSSLVLASQTQWSWFSFSIKSIRLEDASAGRYFRRFGMKNHLFSKKSFHRKKLWYLNSSYSNKLFFGVFLSRKKMINDSLGKFFSELDWKKTHIFSEDLFRQRSFFCWDFLSLRENLLQLKTRSPGISPRILSPGILCLSQQTSQRSTIPLVDYMTLSFVVVRAKKTPNEVKNVQMCRSLVWNDLDYLDTVQTSASEFVSLSH